METRYAILKQTNVQLLLINEIGRYILVFISCNARCFVVVVFRRVLSRPLLVCRYAVLTPCGFNAQYFYRAVLLRAGLSCGVLS